MIWPQIGLSNWTRVVITIVPASAVTVVNRGQKVGRTVTVRRGLRLPVQYLNKSNDIDQSTSSIVARRCTLAN
jgi:hypothetical protein